MRLSLTAFLVFIWLISTCQDGQYNFGARNAGIGYASSTIADGWAIFNNIGSLGMVEESAVLMTYQNRYNISSFQSLGGGAVFATRWATAGLSVFRFGDDIFNEQKIKLAIGHQLQMVSLGAGINLVQFVTEGRETQRRIAIEFGGTVQLSPHFVLAAHIYNFRQTDIIPTVMKAGLSYRPIDQLMINIETEKDLDLQEVFRAGVEYQIITPLYIRTGIQTAPIRSTFGLGYILSSFNVDYAFIDNTSLSASHEISLSYFFKSK